MGITWQISFDSQRIRKNTFIVASFQAEILFQVNVLNIEEDFLHEFLRQKPKNLLLLLSDQFSFLRAFKWHHFCLFVKDIGQQKCWAGVSTFAPKTWKVKSNIWNAHLEWWTKLAECKKMLTIASENL